MAADTDYKKLKELIETFVRSEKVPLRARSIVFYTHVESVLSNYTTPYGEKESKVMREVILRFKRGRGKEGEPTKFHKYFYNKFRKQIQNERYKQTGNRYSRKQRIDK